MKPLVFAGTALAVCFLAADAVQARNRGYTQQKLLFVSETKSPDHAGGTLSLCHLVKDEGIFFVNFFRSSEGYVLAPRSL
jgi:hypothetical protein